MIEDRGISSPALLFLPAAPIVAVRHEADARARRRCVEALALHSAYLCVWRCPGQKLDVHGRHSYMPPGETDATHCAGNREIGGIVHYREIS